MLLSIILIPLLSSLFLLYFSNLVETPSQKKKINFLKIFGLTISLITFLLLVFLWLYFKKTEITYQFEDYITWLPLYALDIQLGVDGISLFFILLTTFLIPLCLLASWHAIKKNIVLYFASFLILETLLILVFSVRDLLFFYICFESVLIPMFLIIGIWGSRERKIKAGYYFFLYTLFGSVFMLLAIMQIYNITGTTNFDILLTTTFTVLEQKILFLAFFVAFASKIPMFPFPIWLPEAHVEAPTAGSVILAGILLKLGGYGFLRIIIPFLPDATFYFKPFICMLCIIGILYASLTTIRQLDLKRIIAYSSIAHMNFVVLGLFTLDIRGLDGAMYLMLGHGIVSSALFLTVGIIYDRYHTRLIFYYGGLVQIMPLFALFFLSFILGNIAMPGTCNFIGEFLILAGLVKRSILLAILSCSGMILGAAYSLWMYNRIVYGDLKVQHLNLFFDISRREYFILLPLFFLMILLGIYSDFCIRNWTLNFHYIIANYKMHCNVLTTTF